MYGEKSNGREDRDVAANTSSGIGEVMWRMLVRAMCVCRRNQGCLEEFNSGGAGVSGGQVRRNGLERAMG